MTTTLFENIGQLVTLAPLSQRGYPSRVTDADLGTLSGAWLHVTDGRVTAWGQGAAPKLSGALKINAHGGLVVPGFVDAHTHPIFAGNRAREFVMRVEGATYQSIAESGGGIQATVKPTRAASDASLLASAKKNLLHFLRHGVTTVECKTGYGVSIVEEERQLRLLGQLKAQTPQHLELTCLALHAWPLPGEDRVAFLRDVNDVLLPIVARDKLASSVDIFLEKGYFSAVELAPYAAKAKSLGLALRFHVDEFTDVSGGLLAAQYGALSADHCECTSVEGARAMAAAKVTAVILPGTSLYSKIPYAQAALFREAGAAIAIATDFNPGSCTFDNLPMMASLSCLYNGTHMAESLAGITYAAAYSLRLPRKGHLDIGADADFCVYSEFSCLEEWLADFGKREPDGVYVAGRNVGAMA